MNFISKSTVVSNHVLLGKCDSPSFLVENPHMHHLFGDYISCGLFLMKQLEN